LADALWANGGDVRGPLKPAQSIGPNNQKAEVGSKDGCPWRLQFSGGAVDRKEILQWNRVNALNCPFQFRPARHRMLILRKNTLYYKMTALF
jgi:hypothetical protein